ncbi:MAG: tetratricopeptide repeat protein [Phycisphaerales bacterium]|nr:tetratricopeptide repeat protein [Phycisphaerales bacterium]
MTIARNITIGLSTLLVASLVACQSTPPAAQGPAAIELVPPTEAQVEQLEVAQAASDAGQYDEALVLFQDLLAENPTITPAYMGIGDIHMVRKNYEQAEPAYARAARLEPNNFDAQYGHGLALQMLERFVEAVRAYRRALRIDPGSTKANLNIATTFLQMTEADRAVDYAERAVALSPDNGAARANLGAIYEELGRSAEAVDSYIAAIELMGNQPPLMLNLINVLGKENRYREAANTALTLIRIEPTANAYERLGWCSFKLREYDDSVDAYRQAVDIDPSHWPSHNGIGVNAINTWLLSKKRDEAAKVVAGDHFRRSLRINPEQPRVIQLVLNYQL